MKKITYISITFLALLAFQSCDECEPTITSLPGDELPFDCQELMANIGDSCDDGNPETINDVITENCECVGEANFNCDNKFIGFAFSFDGGVSDGNYKLETFDKPINPFVNTLLINDVQVNIDQSNFTTNYATYDKLSDRYSFLFRYDVGFPLCQYYSYDYITGQEFIGNLSEVTYAAPVYHNGKLYAIRLFENSNTFSVVRLDEATGDINSVLAIDGLNHNSPLDEKFVSSATNNEGKLYFLSNTNLIIYDLETNNYEYVDIDTNYNPEFPTLYYGLEYDQFNRELIMLRAYQSEDGQIINHLMTIDTDKDKMPRELLHLNPLLEESNDDYVSPEFFDTNLDNCDRTLYISEIVDGEIEPIQSYLISIKLENLSLSVSTAEDYRFGIELID